MTFPLIYFVRHGQTDWNAEGRLQGQAERDINALGQRQATANGEKLRTLIADSSRFDFVASPMLRTRHTMERVRAAMGLDPAAYRTDPRLMELNFGEWQGFTFAELEATTPGVRARRDRDKWNYLPPGEKAESYAMLAARVRGWLGEVTQQTVCVAHGGILRSMFTLIGQVGEEEAGELDIRQDKILRLQGGRLEWL